MADTSCCGCGEKPDLYESVNGEYWCRECWDALPEEDQEDSELTELPLS